MGRRRFGPHVGAEKPGQEKGKFNFKKTHTYNFERLFWFKMIVRCPKVFSSCVDHDKKKKSRSDWNGIFCTAVIMCFQLVCLTSPGRTADEEDWCGRGQTNRVWDEYRISSCWSAVHEGNCWPLLLKWSSNRTWCPHLFSFPFHFSIWCLMLFAFLQVTWRDIAGLDEVINELQDTVILPFQKRHLLAGSKLFQPPKGITACQPKQN